MKLTFTESAWRDYLWFQEQNRPLLKRLNDLIRDTPAKSVSWDWKTRALKG